MSRSSWTDRWGRDMKKRRPKPATALDRLALVSRGRRVDPWVRLAGVRAGLRLSCGWPYSPSVANAGYSVASCDTQGRFSRRVPTRVVYSGSSSGDSGTLSLVLDEARSVASGQRHLMPDATGGRFKERSWRSKQVPISYLPGNPPACRQGRGDPADLIHDRPRQEGRQPALGRGVMDLAIEDVDDLCVGAPLPGRGRRRRPPYIGGLIVKRELSGRAA